MDMKHRTVFSDKVRLIYLQLPYFRKNADNCENVFERFIYVLKHMDELKRMPWELQDAVFKKLSEIAEVGSLSKEERQQYDESLRECRTSITIVNPVAHVACILTVVNLTTNLVVEVYVYVEAVSAQSSSESTISLRKH